MINQSEPLNTFAPTRRGFATTACCVSLVVLAGPASKTISAVRTAPVGAGGQSSDKVVPVTDFGAIGQDDAALLRRALAAARTILIPSGVTLTIASDVVLPPGRALIGAGALSRIRLLSNNAADNIKITLSDGNVLRDLALAEIGARRRTGVYGTIFAQGASHCQIEHVEVSGSSSAGMLFIDSSDVTIDRCSVHDTYADGIHSQRGCTRIAISNCDISRTGDDGIAFVSHGYDQYGRVSDCTVRSCTIMDMAATGSGIGIIGAVGISVADCRIETTPLSGIRIASAAFPGEGSVIGERINIAGNVIVNTGRGARSDDNGGIFIEGNRDVIVRGNRIVRPTTWGIATSNAVEAIRIEGNDIADPGDVGMFISAAPQQGHYRALGNGRTPEGPARGRNIVVEGNTIRNPLASGIHVAGYPGTPIQDIVLRNNIVRGVRRRPGTSAAYGIYVDHADNVVLSGNETIQGEGDRVGDLFIGPAARVRQ